MTDTIKSITDRNCSDVSCEALLLYFFVCTFAEGFLGLQRWLCALLYGWEESTLFMQMMQTILIVVVNLLEKQVPKCIPFSCLGIIVSCNFSANLSYCRNKNISMLIVFQEQWDCMSSAQLYLTEKLASVLYHRQLEHLPAEYYGKVMITKRNINVHALTSLFDLEAYS